MLRDPKGRNILRIVHFLVLKARFMGMIKFPGMPPRTCGVLEVQLYLLTFSGAVTGASGIQSTYGFLVVFELGGSPPRDRFLGPVYDEGE